VWWIKLGIRPERIEPGKPSQNGRHERMHRTLKQETAQPREPISGNSKELSTIFAKSITTNDRTKRCRGKLPPNVTRNRRGPIGVESARWVTRLASRFAR